jgi:biopolymer transport protein ExbD
MLLVGIVLFPSYKSWESTRTWVPVDLPVSLAPGHIRTGDFRINLASLYHIEIEVTDYEYWSTPSCQDYTMTQTRWWLSRNGRVVRTWTDYWGSDLKFHSGTYLGAFDSSSGWYNLDVEIVSDATCLQAFHPRLRVLTDDSDYIRGGSWYELTVLGSFALVGLSFGFWFVSATQPVQRAFTEHHSLAIFETLQSQHKSTQRRLSLMGTASMLPTIGYVYALTYLLLFLAYAPFHLAIWNYSHGLPAKMLRRGVTHFSDVPGLLIYVTRDGRFYLNSVPVSATELSKSLEAEFARRADWSVYVEGDSDGQFQFVAEAMDLVRGAHGKIILLTPNMRKEVEARKQ